MLHGIPKYISFFVLAFPLFASTYVTDSFTINLRSTPASNGRIIQMLPSGEALEIRERQDEWSRVQTASGREGWVLHRYIISRAPWKNQAAAQQRQRERYAKQLEKVRDSLRVSTSELDAVQRSFTRLKGAYDSLDTEYHALRDGSQEYLTLQHEHEEAHKELQQTLQENNELRDENNRLKADSSKVWVLVGGGMVLLGFALAHVPRKQKKRRW
ncbi:TIGR04211 family SH3 domain-containing protein [Chitinivibrio alkaliphilus]|uniref:SH3 type 3 domain protein n=1 Tax=Chitinivibrio alkaliphilus ACht1 TaxID=1313304 RepID=U7D9X0_9BACT|nr:TIGR04211 family SH3 domain-containing protein [Chitinivibrio alkaliphilus]ERP39204.1 SH3 type 3 domain protein [Chitinivibrio alkaliphilus ACht1]